MVTIGIAGYGVYVPRYRITTEEIASVWGKKADEISGSLGVYQKSVPNIDEDAVTLGYEASTYALARSGIDPTKIEVCFVGSESHPYAVNPSATTIAEFLGVGNNYLSADLQFACKAATAGMQAIAGLVEAKQVNYGLVVGSDTAQSRPHDVLEYTAGSCAAAYILGREEKELLATLTHYSSYSSDTPDFWRREGMRYPSHSGRFTGEPAYFIHVLGAAKRLLDKMKKSPKDFDYCVFHMPNGKFPREAAKRLGFNERQLKSSLIVDHIGNPYSGSALCGLGAVLDIAKPGQSIFMVSYGSGAGADSFAFKTTSVLSRKRGKAPTFLDFMKKTESISYTDYLRKEQKI